MKMKSRLVILLILVFGLVACGTNSTPYELRNNLLIGTYYELRDTDFKLVKTAWCWEWDEACKADPFQRNAGNWPVPDK